MLDSRNTTSHEYRAEELASNNYDDVKKVTPISKKSLRGSPVQIPQDVLNLDPNEEPERGDSSENASQPSLLQASRDFTGCALKAN